MALTKCRAVSARFSRFGDTVSKSNAILPAHSVVELASVRCKANIIRPAPTHLQILPSLLGAPFVAGPVLGGDQRVGGSRAFRLLGQDHTVRSEHFAPHGSSDP